ncbi:tubulin epsilon and delta complex protein 1 [Amphiprion ocellaris]|uniref:Tubulin epsilon and delta complex protein 1 domain-containing protein n=1 Tax=Amphiprion ocellaris TaxID=80972 RepID=A0AAQ5Y9Z8_AMPOC|nr:tubulin epsilon and delta complex protein 1 [Amphiprion ocellaris]
MQRAKVSGSVEVKQVIGALCRLLAAAGVDPVPVPENFRRAKFGGGAEEDQFWQLLGSILQKTAVVSSEVDLQLRGASENRKFVAAGLCETGYHADWMYERQGGHAEGGRSFSSRDLLLALGWLLAAGTLEKLLTQRVQQLDKTLLTPVPVNLHLSSELQFDSASLRRLQWLIGRLRHQGRILLSMLQEQTRLLHAVFSASLSSAASSSCGQSSVVLKEDLVCVQQLCDLLEAYLSWRQVEDVFWTWMDSVVDCHLTGPVIKRPTHAQSGSPGVCHHRTWGLDKPDDTLLGLPVDTHTSTPTQEGPRRGRGDVKDRGGGEKGRAGPPFVFSLPSVPFLSQVFRARLQAERPVRQPRAEDLHSSTEAPELKASQAVQLLLHAEALLLERRDRQRLANRTQLQEMIGSLDELVLIPP